MKKHLPRNTKQLEENSKIESTPLNGYDLSVDLKHGKYSVSKPYGIYGCVCGHAGRKSRSSGTQRGIVKQLQLSKV